MILNFHRQVKISSISLQFQGGFVAEECRLYTNNCTLDEANYGLIIWNELLDADVELENTNRLQHFELDQVTNQDHMECESLKLEFIGSTDFYGRVILYKLIVNGINI